MSSDEETNQKSGSERREKRFKKLVVPPKSPKPTKSKGSSFIIKKLKLKTKSSTESDHPSPSTSEQGLLPSKVSPSLERQTPEGDDNFVLSKSASETNLQETWRKSVENLPEAVEKEKEQEKVLPEHTQSLEDLKDMLTYGELILDKTLETVMYNFFYNIE